LKRGDLKNIHRKDAKNAKNNFCKFRNADALEKRTTTTIFSGLFNNQKLCVLCVFAVKNFMYLQDNGKS